MVSRFSGKYFTFEPEHYFFSPDGKVFGGVPPGGPEQFDFAKAEREQPKNCGTYRIEGDKITFTWGGGRSAETLDFAREKDGNIKLVACLRATSGSSTKANG